MATKVSTISLYVGGFLVIGGLSLWYTQDLGTKLFELSNDLVGAGIFATLFGLALRFVGKN